ncbi:hypothetical protein AB4305_07985 [Nocardia sp. 2YAB30]|uniref:hypothetical protein n=1 Tax=unclassified Nocardia TaxID=2637762 RepID=UPI003F9C77ED
MTRADVGPGHGGRECLSGIPPGGMTLRMASPAPAVAGVMVRRPGRSSDRWRPSAAPRIEDGIEFAGDVGGFGVVDSPQHQAWP